MSADAQRDPQRAPNTSCRCVCRRCAAGLSRVRRHTQVLHKRALRCAFAYALSLASSSSRTPCEDARAAAVATRNYARARSKSAPIKCRDCRARASRANRHQEARRRRRRPDRRERPYGSGAAALFDCPICSRVRARSASSLTVGRPHARARHTRRQQAARASSSAPPPPLKERRAMVQLLHRRRRLSTVDERARAHLSTSIRRDATRTCLSAALVGVERARARSHERALVVASLFRLHQPLLDGSGGEFSTRAFVCAKTPAKFADFILLPPSSTSPPPPSPPPPLVARRRRRRSDGRRRGSARLLPRYANHR